MKIEVIGDVDTVMGFKLAGVSGNIAQNSIEAEKILNIPNVNGWKVIIPKKKGANSQKVFFIT